MSYYLTDAAVRTRIECQLTASHGMICNCRFGVGRDNCRSCFKGMGYHDTATDIIPFQLWWFQSSYHF